MADHLFLWRNIKWTSEYSLISLLKYDLEKVFGLYSIYYGKVRYYSAHSPLGLFSDRLRQLLRLCYLLSLDLSLQQLWCYFPNYVYPNPLCQLSLWEETGAPRKNPRHSVEYSQTLVTWVRSENRPTISEVKGACSDNHRRTRQGAGGQLPPPPPN